MRVVTIFLIIFLWTASAFTAERNHKIDYSRIFKGHVKTYKFRTEKLPYFEPQTIAPYREDGLSIQSAPMVAAKIKTDHSVAIKVDSSRNGFGWLNPGIRSIDRFAGTDAWGAEADFLVAGYRQYIVTTVKTGIIGATTVDVANGLESGEVYRHVELNQDLYEGTKGGRYPGAVALDRPFIHFNQYKSGNASDTPALSNPYIITDYGSYGLNGGLWTPSMRMDVGYKHYNFENNRLWNGPVEVVKDDAGTYYYAGVYRNWTIEGESQPYGYVILNAESDDPTSGWTIDTSPTTIDTMNFFLFPSISINKSGFGVCVGLGHSGIHPSPYFYYKDLRLMVLITYDFGKTWSNVREVSWAELGVPESVTLEDSIFVPGADDTTMVPYKGSVYLAIPNADPVDVIVSEDNKVYVAYDLIWGPWASDSTFYIYPQGTGLHLAISENEGITFKDVKVTTNNGFYVGDSLSDGVESNFIFRSEADISLDEAGNLYLTWLDRPHVNIKENTILRYGRTNEDITLKADVFVSRSTDGGKTWTWKRNVTKTVNTDEYELNAVRKASSSNNGTVYFAYCEVNPAEPIDPTQAEEDNYLYRVNRIWIGEAYNFSDTTVGIADGSKLIADKHSLMQNYPNPFNPTTNIEFKPNESGRVTLEVFDVNGRLVQKLFDDKVQANRLYRVEFKGNNLSSGIYFYRLKINNHLETRKMVLMR
ncbi:MAG: T9SS type A sorting domain-containing protein [Calditrichaeota bacterium]|nr:T9SS type A sorting domain-containing protein [Calditrichota bacterium]